MQLIENVYVNLNKFLDFHLPDIVLELDDNHHDAHVILSLSHVHNVDITAIMHWFKRFECLKEPMFLDYIQNKIFRTFWNQDEDDI